MGTSYTEFEGHGFWTRDRYLETWVNCLADELAKTNEECLVPLIKHWKAQAAIDGGCVSLNLDKFLADPSRRDLILSLSQRALPRCPEDAQRTGQLFIELLSGRLTTVASSPIDYL